MKKEQPARGDVNMRKKRIQQMMKAWSNRFCHVRNIATFVCALYNWSLYSQQESHREIRRAVTKYDKLLKFSVIFVLQKPRHFPESDPPKGIGSKV